MRRLTMGAALDASLRPAFARRGDRSVAVSLPSSTSPWTPSDERLGRPDGPPRSARYAPRMSNLIDIVDAPLLQVWGEAVRARRVQGERITLAVVELAPNAEVPEHRHDAEQLGMVIRGEVRFRLDGETRILAPGGTWRITSNRPHQVSAGPDGAVVIDVFTPVRSDWDSLPVIDGATPRWPDGG